MGIEIAERPVVVITGASAGIGAATARLMAERRGARLLLVARRADRLAEVAAGLPGAVEVRTLAVDLVEDDAPARVLAAVEEHFGRLDILVNNAGAAWRGDFAETGFEGVRRNMELDFDAVLRLTEALLPMLRRSAPSSVVNVSSVAGRVARAGSGGYNAAKFALVGWTDALRLEETAHGVSVGQVMPGFIATEGFKHEKIRRSPLTGWSVSTAEKVAEAIDDVAFSGKPERYVPRPYWLGAAMRFHFPRLTLALLGRGNRRF